MMVIEQAVRIAGLVMIVALVAAGVLEIITFSERDK